MNVFKIICLVGAAALMFAFPAAAAVSTGEIIVGPAELLSPKADAGLVCQADIDISATVLFFEVTENCDPAIAEATGLCFAYAPNSLAFSAVAIAPDGNMTCSTSRPAPPG